MRRALRGDDLPYAVRGGIEARTGTIPPPGPPAPRMVGSADVDDVPDVAGNVTGLQARAARLLDGPVGGLSHRGMYEMAPRGFEPDAPAGPESDVTKKPGGSREARRTGGPANTPADVTATTFRDLELGCLVARVLWSLEPDRGRR
ncbi:hypothetical protein GCM10022252_48660 [Streptosporangium oxazolinicum]|uniref:Uncharacterized protein n=1 Tax=Streptosporangium oxazolinicum TaxID=909287 RepID=A0ABP8B548_9ACTN